MSSESQKRKILEKIQLVLEMSSRESSALNPSLVLQVLAEYGQQSTSSQPGRLLTIWKTSESINKLGLTLSLGVLERWKMETVQPRACASV